MDINKDKAPVHRKKVLIVLSYYLPYVSGVTIYAQRLAEGMVARGYDVTILTSRHEKNLLKTEVINGVEIVRRPVIAKLNKGVIMPTFWLDVVRYARHADIVNFHLPLADTGLSSLFIPKRKLVVTYQCDIFLGNKLLDRLITLIAMILMRIQLTRASVVVPSSRDYLVHSKMRGYLSKALPIHPPVPVEDYSHVNSTDFFKTLGVKRRTIKIGFVGRIVYEKGIDYLLGSIPYIQKELKDFQIIIAGDYTKVAGGSIKAQLDHFMEKYPGSILFTGYLSEAQKIEFYSGIDVLVLPSIDPLEAYGMVQVEAMLCGTPVVASNLPGVREVVRRSGYGEISAIRDSKDIARKIVKVVTYAKSYKPDRTKVAKLFGEAPAIDAYVDCFEELGAQ